MKRWIKTGLIAISAIALSLVVFALFMSYVLYKEVDKAGRGPAQRPGNIAKTAFYVSDAKDGQWFNCEPADKKSSELDCESYSAFEGEKLQTGKFRTYKVDYRTAAYQREEIIFMRPIYSGHYSGRNIVTSESIVFKPVGKHMFLEGGKEEIDFGYIPDSGDNIWGEDFPAGFGEQ
ncbi:hypothetical protein ACFL6Y_10090 [Elusimicrobiota bacterium]